MALALNLLHAKKARFFSLHTECHYRTAANPITMVVESGTFVA